MPFHLQIPISGTFCNVRIPQFCEKTKKANSLRVQCRARLFQTAQLGRNEFNVGESEGLFLG